MTGSLKPLFSDLDRSLRELTRGAAAAVELADAVRQSLSETLRPHVVAAARRGDDLVVIVDSAAWATRIRYAGPRLREALDARGEVVKGRLRVRVGRPAAAPGA